jgi:hypothetical protein
MKMHQYYNTVTAIRTLTTVPISNWAFAQQLNLKITAYLIAMIEPQSVSIATKHRSW